MKFAEIKNMPVVSVADATRLGFVDTLYLDITHHLVVGMRIRRGGLITHHEACLLQDVQAFGKDAVTVQDASKLNEPSKFAILQGAVDLETVTGAKIMDESGDAAGSVHDINFDQQSGSISSYILAPGLMDRLRHDEHDIPAGAVRSFGNKIMVIASSTTTQEAAGTETPPPHQ